MSVPTPADGAMKTLRFHAYGDPLDVLRVEEAPIPVPGPGRVRVRVAACGLNPADWVLCRGLFASDLPRGVGLDVSGVVDALGEGVTDVAIGDPVLGPADYAGCASAGASDYAVLTHWAKVPPGLDMIHAASLTMAVETAFRGVDLLGVATGQTLLVSGAGTMVGFAAAQMGLLRRARVIATAGETFAPRLRALGAIVVSYGEGMIERVREAAGAPPDLVFDAAPVNLKLDHAPADGVLADLVEIAGGDPRRVLTCVDFARAAALGVRTGQGEQVNADGTPRLRYDALSDFARLAAEGLFSIPLARTFALEEWPAALELSFSGRAHGKLVILPDAPATI